MFWGDWKPGNYCRKAMWLYDVKFFSKRAGPGQARPGLPSTSMEGSFTGKAHSLLANNGKLGKFWVLLQQLKISGKGENVEEKKKKIWKKKNPWKLNKPKDILRIPLFATRKFQNRMFGVLGQRTAPSYITVCLGNKAKMLVF